jgi:hypothetical protein
MSLFPNPQILDRGLAALQAKMGEFLQAKNALFEIGDRLNALRRSRNAQVRNAADVLASKQRAYMTRQGALEARAITAARDAAQVREQAVKTAAGLKNINIKILGSRPLEVIREHGRRLIDAAKGTGALVKEVAAHLEDVKGLRKDADRLEAQLTGRLTGGKIFGGITETVGNLKFVLIGAAVLYGLTIVGPAVKSYLPVRRNPRRRRQG